MLKYTNAQVTFSEVPDEITLCIEISNCPYHCPECHSKHLWNDVGNVLDVPTLQELIDKNKGITCICFMGGDSDMETLRELMFSCHLRSDYPYKLAWYTGNNEFPDDNILDLLDYIKLGPYKAECGGLDNPNTNQRFYARGVTGLKKMGAYANMFYDITDRFWRDGGDL